MATALGSRLYTLAETAVMLGVTYSMLREQVTVRGVVNYYRRGEPGGTKRRGSGSEVLLDEQAIGDLRLLFADRGISAPAGVPA